MLQIRHIKNGQFSGKVKLPASKSMVNRWLIIQSLSGPHKALSNPFQSHDVVILENALGSDSRKIDFEDAGTPLRLFIAYAALRGSDAVIDGYETLRSRPLKPLLQALEQAGAIFEYIGEPWSLPLKVMKRVDRSTSEIHIDGSISSQFVSAILLIAPYFNQGLVVGIDGHKTSVPYIDMTVSVMREAGIEVEVNDIQYRVGKGVYKAPQNINMEADWSAATFLYALFVLSAEQDFQIPGLRLASEQGDRYTAVLFEQFGVSTQEDAHGIRLHKTGKPASGIEVDFRDVPDMFPAVAALCAALRIPARMSGIVNLAVKESDRVKAMESNLEQLGVEFQRPSADALVMVYKDSRLPASCEFLTFNDHRIAMACSMFAFKCDITLDDETVVRKSFPGYWTEFMRLCGIA